MNKIRNSVLQANVLCDELDDQDPRKVIDHEEYTGMWRKANISAKSSILSGAEQVLSNEFPRG